jgi:membrane-associated phospholipid phosphatase
LQFIFRNITLIFCLAFCFSLPYKNASGQQWELHMLNAIHVHRNASLDPTMHLITESAYPIAIAAPIVQSLIGVLASEPAQIQFSLQTAGSLLLAAGATYVFKEAIQRKRPYIEHPQYKPHTWEDSPSFPSGHTSLAFSTATSLSLEYKKWYVVVPSFAWATAVGYSRMHLGEHYPGDVFMGALTGISASMISYYLNQWLQHKWSKPKSNPIVP